MRHLLLLAAVSALAASGPASAQAPTGLRLSTTADLLAMCDPASGDGQDIRVAQCNGFIAGAGLFYRELVAAKAIRPWVCAPQNTSLNEARSAFVSWAKATPGSLEGAAINGFWNAMSSRWPCS